MKQISNPFGEAGPSPVRQFPTTMVLVLTMLILIAILLVFSIRPGSVEGTEAGVMINNITGAVEIIRDPGTTIYNSLYKTFYTIDKTEQKLEMAGSDRLRVKTLDGSDVQLNLTVQYKVDLSKVDRIIADSGLEPSTARNQQYGSNLYKAKWARDYARSICRTVFGELTTEEFYDTGKRTQKANESRERLNDALNEHGLIVTVVIPNEFEFYKEYEDKINEKKLADQEVEQQRSEARAAEQAKERRRVEANKAKEVAIAAFTGEMEQLIVQAKAEAERLKRAADAYAIQTQVGADAEFYRLEKDAAAELAKRKSEAEGVAQMAKALTGEGGVNIVKMEYAQRLRQMPVSGQPFTIEGRTERFSHTGESATTPQQASGGASANAETPTAEGL